MQVFPFLLLLLLSRQDKWKRQLASLKAAANERGSPPQRLISHFVDALVTRQQGRGAERYTMGLNVSAQEMAASMERCFSTLPYVDFCHVAAFDSLLKVAVGQRRLHILVFGFWMSHHWVKLLQVGIGF